MGYKVKCNIGCSEFKVDIGIVDPENENEYLLGILLDGENNTNNSTARDRFILQPSVLQGLGWNITRIWILDWFDDKERVLKNIKTAVDNIPVREKAETVTVKSVVFAGINFEKDETNYSVAKAYICAELKAEGSPDDFYLPQNKSKIKKAAEEIIDAEALVSRKLLMKKVLSRWSITRGGSRVESIFLDAISTLPITATTDEDRVFIWKKGQLPEAYKGYRIDNSESGKRSMDEIASEEIFNAAIEVLSEQVSLSETDLIRETAKKFGFSRMGGIIEGTVGYSIHKNIFAGKLVKNDNGSITAADSDF